MGPALVRAPAVDLLRTHAVSLSLLPSSASWDFPAHSGTPGVHGGFRGPSGELPEGSLQAAQPQGSCRLWRPRKGAPCCPRSWDLGGPEARGPGRRRPRGIGLRIGSGVGAPGRGGGSEQGVCPHSSSGLQSPEPLICVSIGAGPPAHWVSAPIAEKELHALLPCGPHRPFPMGLSSRAPASRQPRRAALGSRTSLRNSGGSN